jgi:ferredoxin
MTTEAPSPTWYTATVATEGLQVDAPDNQPLLLSLEQGGANWMSSCRNGTCRTCIGQLSEGSVRYEIEWPGLSTEEMDEGYVLPCVAYPCSNVVINPA